ncbi:MAG: cytochrome c3 family protein [Planctomycetota bacterium]
MSSQFRLSAKWSLLGGLTAILGLAWVGAQASDRPARLSDLEFRPMGALATPGALVDDSSCIKCHQFEAAVSHPVDVMATARKPGSLPLRNGMVVCSTCHDASAQHGVTHDRVGVRWGKAATDACTQCHQNNAPGTRLSHAIAVGRAHPAREIPATTLGASPRLDSESTACMSCHDGAVASEAGWHAAARAISGGPTDHPIGVPLRASSRKSKSDFKLADPGRLDRRIKLVQGNLSCGTCHSAYSSERAQLVMNNQGSELCLNCHKQ